MINSDKVDIASNIEVYQYKNSPTDRYASFDYCYHYFKTSRSEELLQDIEKSCLVLGFYLASWGMLRGSSFLLQHSVKYYQPLIEYIASLDKTIWDIDVDSYDKDNITILLGIYDGCKERLIQNKNQHLTLVTKVMLGVFGFVPAYDSYFCQTFRTLYTGRCGFRRFNIKSLTFIHEFYLQNQIQIDKLAQTIRVKEFATGKNTSLYYPKAKIIDMYGFSKAFNQKT